MPKARLPRPRKKRLNLIHTGKDGKKAYHMNPQAGKALHSKGDQANEEQVGHSADGGSDYVEIHKGGHPEGQPPMTEGHTHHTIHHSGDSAEVKNHDDFASVEAELKQCMGETGEDTSADDYSDDGA